MKTELAAYQEIYITEAQQCLEELQRQLAQLEAGAPDPGGLEAAYRAAHTLAGDSATMGYEDLAALAYEIEATFKGAVQEGHPLPAGFAITLRAALGHLEKALEAMG